ncbi:hypothetical protein [Bradyrhizobium sp. USDA 10063]
MSDCKPNGGATPIVVDNPCAMLNALRAAYYQLLAGQARAQVRNGDQWLEFHRPDTKTLEREIRRLEIVCESGNAGRAVRVGPRYPRLHSPFRRY